MIAASTMLGRMMRLYRRFAATYRRGDAAFPPVTAAPREPELLRLAGEVRAMGVVPAALVDRLVEHLRSAPDEAVAHMRPFVLADAWGHPRMEVLRLCLHATRVGLLDLTWDILCPNCRVAKASVSSLAALPGRAHCDLCHIQFDVNFDEYVELRFTVNPTVRVVAEQTYCVSGPATTRHILVQQHLRPGERKEVRVSLAEGEYRVRTRQLQARAVLEVRGQERGAPAYPARATVTFGEACGPEKGHGFGRPGRVEPSALILRSGEVALTLHNASDGEVLALIEETAWGAQHVSGSLVTSLSEFRHLFSSEMLAPGLDVAIRNLTLLFTDLKGSTALYSDVGDSRAYALVRDHPTELRRAIDDQGGVLVKTIGDAVMAAFSSGADGVAAALAMQRGVAALNRAHPERAALCLKVGLHRGPCVAITANGVLDYFGTSVNLAARAQSVSEGDDVVITAELMADEAVGVLIAQAGLAPEHFTSELKGFGAPLHLYRLRLADGWAGDWEEI
jgi:class 3 adenylate cyclase